MLQEIRDKSQGWIAKTIIGVIVLLLALTGFEAIFRAVSNDGEVASVNGEGIATAEFNDTYQQQRYILSANGQFDGTPEAVKELKKLVTDNLINYRILVQAATNAGFSYLPEAYIKHAIENNPLYQTNGQFDYSLFEQDIRSYGYGSDKQFVRDQLDRNLLSQLQSGIVDANFVTDDRTQYLASLLEQTRDFSYKELEANKVANISDEEIKNWYENHKDTLKTPEQVVLEYIELNRNSFLEQTTVSDKELNDLYAKKVVELNKAAVRQRIAHILIPITANQTAEQAKTKIDAIEAELKQGKDFAAVAKEQSQDTGTADKGGDLGFVTTEDLPDPEAFAPVLTTLTKVGDVSEPVLSRFGWHIIKLTDVQKASVPSFESLREQLAGELKQQKAYDAYLAEQRKLDAAAYENYDNLAQVAKDFNLTLKETKPFGRETGYDVITTNDKVIKAAFSDSLLKNEENSGIIEVTPNTSIIVHVKQHLQPSNMTLEQATPEIKVALQKEKTQLEGEQLVADLKAGKVAINDTWKTFKSVKQPLQLSAEEFQKLSLTPDILESLFAIPKPVEDKPSIYGTTLKNGNYAVIALSKVNEFVGNLSDEDKLQYQTLAANDSANKLWEEYRQYLKDNAEIKYFDNEE
ncbi:SurA N-terminal domain-containing protein [Entomomonas asaccharolytica]|uniref:Periplasmic chaperone PpiD n=1 Tax=Entomomonas asaccharolytica TaxID=2785331 RepID=A0A974NHD3_9GAMM|nr:SurA N-terminal domain-containing protein [Entomomonas asaccharolytica]QQP86620.1 SurA N-terminal domain-containing protein [Entomomonas asaccharolytica]